MQYCYFMFLDSNNTVRLHRPNIPCVLHMHDILLGVVFNYMYSVWQSSTHQLSVIVTLAPPSLSHSCVYECRHAEQ